MCLKITKKESLDDRILYDDIPGKQSLNVKSSELNLVTSI